MPLNLSRLLPALIILVLCTALLPWAVSVLRTPLHSDLVWLYEGFVRLASGQHMADSIFEPNPPLSLFTYALPFYLTALTGLPSWVTIFVYVMGMLVLGACVVRYAVARIAVTDSYTPWLVMAAYVISQSVMTTTIYGERDHLIGIVLLPFVLLQYLLNRDISVPKKLQWPVFLIGAVFILLKPHHGLIPFFMIVWRMMQKKNLRFMRDADFQALTIAVLAYGALLCFGFADYRQIIFPDVVRFYLSNVSPDIIKHTAMLLIPGFVVLALSHVLRYRIHHGALVSFLALCAILSLIPYYVQGKGFFYHLFPAFAFFSPAFFLLLTGLLEREAKNIRAAFLLSLTALIGISYAIFPLNMALPTYRDYQDKPLTKAIVENCEGAQDCRFFMFNDTMGIIHETAYVTGYTHASRFPSFWFLPKMIEMEQGMSGSADTARLAYAARVAEDLARYQPQTLVIGRFPVKGKEFFDFAAWWAVSDMFRAEWEKYEHTGTLDIAYSDYYFGTTAANDKAITYDIYRRRGVNQ